WPLGAADLAYGRRCGREGNGGRLGRVRPFDGPRFGYRPFVSALTRHRQILPETPRLRTTTGGALRFSANPDFRIEWHRSTDSSLTMSASRRAVRPPRAFYTRS